MSNEVYANNMEVSCKAAAGKSIAAFPDVCFTPPQTPATPPGVPIPYPNTGMASDATGGPTSVQCDGGNMPMVKGATYKTTSGDEAGTLGGVISNATKGEAEFMMYSFDVKFDGKNVCRLGDPLFHNKKNIMG